MLGTVVVGVIFTDIKGFSQGAYVPQGRNLGRISFTHGGVSRNIAENFAVSGMPVTFVSMTEDGALGKEAVERLTSCGVNTEFVLPTRENGIGKWMVILNEDGDVAGQISCPPDMQPLAEFVASYGSAFVRDADQIVLEMDVGETISEQILSLAEQYGKKVYPIVGNMSVLLRRQDLIRRTACFICNEIEIGRLFEADYTRFSPQEMLKMLCAEVPAHGYPATVVTMGAQGSVFYDPASGDFGIVPAIPTVTVDTSGAGDAFLSGTVMGLSNGLCLRDAIGIGTKLASLTVRSTESACPVNTVPADVFGARNGEATAAFVAMLES